MEAQGGTLANVVKLNTYVLDVRHRPEIAPVREEFFGKKAPSVHADPGAALAHRTG